MPRTTQIFCASTLYGAATLAAALDAGLFEPADRRLLLVTNNATNPETTPSVDAMPGFDRLRERFDEVLSWNATIAPFHPSGWSPRADDIPMWERYVRLLWNLGDDEVQLAVESVQVNPALALCQLFTGAPVDVYADGLISYGPTRDKIDPLVGTRIGRLLHLDLVPGLTPLLLTEFGVPTELVPSEAFLKVLGELAEAETDLPTAPADATDARPALLLGQYLGALGILTDAEEEDLHRQMVRGAVALGHRRLVFKPHPVAPARWSRLLEDEAKNLGAELTLLDRPVLAEVAFQRLRPALVVGCFSTALLTAAGLYGVPVARVGTDTLLARLAPYQNSNRVPLTIVDALLPDVADASAVSGWAMPPRERVDELAALLKAVGFAMQPKIYPGLRDAAEAYLSQHLTPHTWRYFKRKRLTSLALPGAVPAQLSFIPRNATVRRLARRARALKRAAVKG
ncbi:MULTISPECIES: polysialyltransferase family glycosyltransferase [unclassified Streptomyces]|uniref:polysialyltransferase family glycosyltransferase n=1 Tax=unclassified Streptomyces TaxID=2593676 RepID=UPI0023657F25|nr:MULTISPECIES: polysialyltransferase family glycosyltransferase [unclassified Streptomyces]MDF3144402.1 polysialyltransferase family glycosyltransferase [Streptomyces sp. T21Q-yed]WDF40776.1 polysialyltransferase family glycosyltransferase [Streptomyces sp. T12]